MEMVEPSRLGKVNFMKDAGGRYIEFCKNSIPFRTSLRGLKVVLDCAHGATYHVAPSIFRELGAEVIEIGVSPDGLNINKDCGALHPDNMRSMVLEKQADVGIAFDGDGDRVLIASFDESMVLATPPTAEDLERALNGPPTEPGLPGAP